MKTFISELIERGYSEDEAAVLNLISIGKNSEDISRILQMEMSDANEMCDRLCTEHYADDVSQLTSQFGMMKMERFPIAFMLSTRVEWMSA